MYINLWKAVRVLQICGIERKRKKPDLDIWQKPLCPQKNPKSNVTTQKRLQTNIGRSVGVTTGLHATGVVKPVYGIDNYNRHVRYMMRWSDVLINSLLNFKCQQIWNEITLLIFYLAIGTVQSLPDLLSWRQISLKLNTNTLIEFNKATNEMYTLSLYTEQVVQNEQKY